ncbi:MAG: hypothetical protein M1482_08315 [Chloroflexi bacterium]|nr:hypothetical protein [Chloroflexota bacterium]
MDRGDPYYNAEMRAIWASKTTSAAATTSDEQGPSKDPNDGFHRVDLWLSDPKARDKAVTGDSTSGGAGDLPAPQQIGPAPGLHATGRAEGTLLWYQTGFECVGKVCVPVYSRDQGNLLVDIYLSGGKGLRTGGRVLTMELVPSQETLKEMQLDVIFELHNTRGQSLTRNYTIIGDTVFDFYENSKDIPTGTVIEASSSVDVRGGLPAKVDFWGSKKPPYEFSFGDTKGYDSLPWVVPDLWR